MGEKKIKPPKLPAGAPQELKDFIACKATELHLDPAQVEWLPRPDLVPEGLAPTITATANGDNAINVAMGWGFISVSLPASVVDGQLKVDATNIPGAQAIDEWVKTFNDSLKSNGKELSGLELKDDKIHLTKRVIAAQVETAPAVFAPPTPIVPPTAIASPDPKSKLKPAVLIGILAALSLVAVVTALIVHNGDDGAADLQATTTSHAPTTTVKPIDEREVCSNRLVLEQVLTDFGTDDPCTIDPDDFWEACDDAFMPCFDNVVPLVVLGPAVGITHAGSIPDAVSGQTGPSQAEHQVQLVGPLGDATATIDVISQCGDATLTGQSPLAATGVTSVKHPLVALGGCTAQVNYHTAAFTRVLGSYTYTVTDQPIAAGAPIVDDITVPTETALNDAGTTLGLLAGRPLDVNCTWFNAQGYPFALSGCASNYWVFNAAHADPRISSFGAGWINPLGAPAPTVDQMLPFGASRLFGPGTLYPCGQGHLGYTACPKDEATVETSSFIAGTVSWSTRLDSMPAGTFVEVGVGEYWVRLLREANAWTLTSSEGDDSQARAILRGDSITFMIPHDEPATPDLAYTVTVGDDTGEIAQAPQPVLGDVASNQGPETPSDFFQLLSNSIASGDLTYALERLHPLVLEAFPGDACHTELALRVAPDYRIALNSVGDTAPWTWELPDGRSFEIEDAITVSILLPGTTEPVDAHIVNIDRKHYWFTVCDGR